MQEKLEKKLGVSFQTKHYLTEALTHCSYTGHLKQQNNKKVPLNNERLEFFGDAILKCVCSIYLFEKYPQENEGTLTKKRAHLISDEALSLVATWYGISEFILISKSELKSGGLQKNSILGNAFEAIIGAIFLDQGLMATQTFLCPIFEKLEPLIGELIQEDSKSILQELLQQHQLALPKYKTKKTTGPDHNKSFFISVEIALNEGLKHFNGKGKTKKRAEQTAAQEALNFLKDYSFQ